MYHRLEYPLFSHSVNEYGQEKNYPSNDGISSNQAAYKRSQSIDKHEGKIKKSKIKKKKTRKKIKGHLK